MRNSSNKIHILKSLIAFTGLFLVGFLLGNLGLFNNTTTDCKVAQTNVLGTTTPTTLLTPTTSTVVKSDDILDTTRTVFLGSATAPVTMVEYTDYQCPYCQRYYFDAFQKIKDNYIKTGKVKYEVKSFPLNFHPAAKPAAIASKCALEQEAFWPMHKKIFTLQAEWSNSDNENQNFTTYAFELGLDANKFSACLKSSADKYEKIRDTETAEGNSDGFSGTPSFTINDQKIVGAQPYANFVKAIESELAKK